MYPGWSIISVRCSSQLSISRFGSCFTKKSDFGTLKIEKVLLKKHFSWEELKIGLRGIPCHPNAHERVRYGLILTNYAMIGAKPSSFDLKVMQPRT
jgi:hypothetical protein